MSQHGDGLTGIARTQRKGHSLSLSLPYLGIYFDKTLREAVSSRSLLPLNLAESWQQFPHLSGRSCHPVRYGEMASLESWGNESW